MNEKEIILHIKNDQWMIDILKCVKLLNLPDWWICAGFVRSKIWDILHNVSERTPISDIDVIYFNGATINEVEEKKLEQKLTSLMPEVPWSVKNQARMHLANNVLPYSSSVDAISKFPETATALGVKIDEQNNILLTAPHGINDVVQLQVKPTPFFKRTAERRKIYNDRVQDKYWQSTWNKLHIHYNNL